MARLSRARAGVAPGIVSGEAEGCYDEQTDGLNLRGRKSRRGLCGYRLVSWAAKFHTAVTRRRDDDGRDVPMFERCLTQHRSAGSVNTDMAFGKKAGIDGTPSVFVNGRQVTVVASEQLRTLIRQLSQKSDVAASVAGPKETAAQKASR